MKNQSYVNTYFRKTDNSKTNNSKTNKSKTKNRRYNLFCKEKSKLFQASVTIEAAFIVPIIIFTFIAIVYLVFFLFNSIKAEGDADRLLFGAEQKLDVLTEYQEKNGVLTYILEGYLDAPQSAGAVSVEEDTLRAVISSRMNINDIPLISLTSFGEIKCHKELELIDRSERGRQIVAVYEALGIIKKIIE